MEHHRCFRVYVTRTRATRISDTVLFKHQYITNPEISPESHVVASAQQLATALKGNIPAGNETAEALTKVSELFTKIAMAKQAVTAAKEQRIRLRKDATTQITHIPRVDEPLPRVNEPPPRVDEPSPRIAEPKGRQAPASAHPLTPQNDENAPASWQNYISQDKESDNPPPPATNDASSHTNGNGQRRNRRGR
jgi:hypothetical protein